MPVYSLCGTTDPLGDLRARHNHVVTTAQRIALRYGYEDMAMPIFEFTDVFSKPLMPVLMWSQKKPIAEDRECCLPCALKARPDVCALLVWSDTVAA